MGPEGNSGFSLGAVSDLRARGMRFSGQVEPPIDVKSWSAGWLSWVWWVGWLVGWVGGLGVFFFFFFFLLFSSQECCGSPYPPVPCGLG